MTHPSVDLLHDVANLTNLTNSTNSSSTTVGPPGSEGVRQLEGHRAAVLAVAFSPDGSRLVTGSVDGTLRVWERATGRLLASIGSAGLGQVTAVALQGDGFLIAGYSSGAVRLHPATPAAALERGCGLARRFAQEAKAAPYCDAVP